MTEIPEHLLQRSRDRRAALGGGGDDSPAAAGAAAPAVAAAASAPAVKAQAAVATVAKPAPPPPPHVQAALRRKKVPLWAMPVLLGLPIWAYAYVGTLERPPQAAAGLLAVGEETYSRCASCHGGTGGGGTGPAFTDGAVVETFPNLLEHVEWVIKGSDGWGRPTYGSQAQPLEGGMPGWAVGLTQEELLGVVLYERVELGGDEALGAVVPLIEEAIDAGDVEGYEPEGNFDNEITLTDLEEIFGPALDEAAEG